MTLTADMSNGFFVGFPLQNFQEFYNVTADPHQLTNTIHKLDPKFITSQNEKLIVLSMCKGPSCRQLIPPPPTPTSKHDNAIDGA